MPIRVDSYSSNRISKGQRVVCFAPSKLPRFYGRARRARREKRFRFKMRDHQKGSRALETTFGFVRAKHTNVNVADQAGRWLGHHV